MQYRPTEQSPRILGSFRSSRQRRPFRPRRCRQIIFNKNVSKTIPHESLLKPQFVASKNAKITACTDSTPLPSFVRFCAKRTRLERPGREDTWNSIRA